jgi:hypothetical protein
MCLDVKKRPRETGVNDSFYFHGDEDGPQEDSLKTPDIGQPEDKKRTCLRTCEDI